MSSPTGIGPPIGRRKLRKIGNKPNPNANPNPNPNSLSEIPKILSNNSSGSSPEYPLVFDSPTRSVKSPDPTNPNSTTASPSNTNPYPNTTNASPSHTAHTNPTSPGYIGHTVSSILRGTRRVGGTRKKSRKKRKTRRKKSKKKKS